MIASSFAFSLMSLFVKLAGTRLPTQEIVAARALISVILSYAVLVRVGVPIWGVHRGSLVARGVVGFVALSLVYYALTQLPLAEATVIQYLHPMFTALLAAVFLGERPGPAVLGCIALSFVGLLFVAQPSFLFGGAGVSLPPLALGAALLGSFMSGCAYVLVRQLASKENPLVIVFYFPLVSLPATLPFLLHNAVWPRGIEWFMLLGVGVCTQVGQVCLTKGVQLETASRATSYSYLQILFAAGWGALFLGELPTLWTILGGLLIVGGSLLSMSDRSKAHAK
jgi:drug/metabolite transporter (DMT)-like permease